MTTTELIKILKDNEYGGISHKSRELSLTINGKYMPNPQITLSSTGDGIVGPEIDLDIEGEFFEDQEPKTGHWIDLNELEEGISRGCEFAGTQEVVHDTFLKCINELSGVGDWDEMTTIDLNDKEIVLQDLMERFYDKIARSIYNYATTCCREG